MAAAAIEATTRFFVSMGVKTRLADYGLAAEVIPTVIAKVREHDNIALGERRNVTPEDVARILALSCRTGKSDLPSEIPLLSHAHKCMQSCAINLTPAYHYHNNGNPC